MTLKPDKRQIEEWKKTLKISQADSDWIRKSQERYAESEPYWNKLEANNLPSISNSMIREQSKLTCDSF